MLLCCLEFILFEISDEKEQHRCYRQDISDTLVSASLILNSFLMKFYDNSMGNERILI